MMRRYQKTREKLEKMTIGCLQELDKVVYRRREGGINDY